MMVVQRCGHADDQRIHFSGARKIRAGLQKAPGLHSTNLRRRDVLNVAAAFVDRVHLLLIHIQADHLIAVAVEIQRQWQADIPEPENGDAGFLVLNAGEGGHGRKEMSAGVPGAQCVVWKI